MTYAGDRLRQAVEAVVQAMMPSPVYSGAWPGVVTSWDEGRQRAEIAMDAGSPLPRTLRSVTALVDPPGTKVTIPNGTPVLVAFRGNNPAAPYFRPAASWGDASVPLPTVGLAGGGEPVARVKDNVNVGTIQCVNLPPPSLPGSTALVYFPPGSVVPIPIVSFLVTSGAVSGPPVPLSGEISSGSDLVTCG